MQGTWPVNTALSLLLFGAEENSGFLISQKSKVSVSLAFYADTKLLLSLVLHLY